MKPSLHILADNEAVARDFAAWLVEWAARPGKLTIALSGGSTPKVLFRILAEQYVQEIDWQRVHFFWGDERCVPPDDEDSNFGMTQELLLRHLDIPLANVHRIRGENDPTAEAQRYSERILEIVNQDEDLPVFDLIILGMGADGHTASIFPHEKELLLDQRICAVATHPESGQQRITLTGTVLNRAKQIAFLVTGASKTDKVRQIIHQEGAFNNYPAAHIQPIGGKVDWFLDKAAAAELEQ